MNLPNELWYDVFSFLTQESQRKFSCLWNLYDLSAKEIELIHSSNDLLCDCARKGYSKLMKLVSKQCNDPNIQDDAGNTALHWACSFGKKEIVEILIKAGADPNIQDNFGWTVLHCSKLLGHEEITEFLIKYSTDLSIKDNNGNTYKDFIE